MRRFLHAYIIGQIREKVKSQTKDSLKTALSYGKIAHYYLERVYMNNEKVFLMNFGKVYRLLSDKLIDKTAEGKPMKKILRK